MSQESRTTEPTEQGGDGSADQAGVPVGDVETPPLPGWVPHADLDGGLEGGGDGSGGQPGSTSPTRTVPGGAGATGTGTMIGS